MLDRCAGTRSAPRDALIASSVDEKNRGRAFGLEGVGDNAGAFLGPSIQPISVLAKKIAAVMRTCSQRARDCCSRLDAPPQSA
jgi:hypothetical protein